MNILIIEDELLIAEMLKEMLVDLGYHVLKVAKNFREGIDELNNNTSIDLVILDINLAEEKTGIDVAGKINDTFNIPFIFLTSYTDEKTIKMALKEKPEAYLVKPFTSLDLYTTIEIVKTRRKNQPQSIIIKDGHLNVKVKSDDIYWIKTDNIYLELVTPDKTYVVRNSLDKFLEEINDNNFVRIHRSYAVNINHVNAVNGQYVIINNEKIPFSRKHRDQIMTMFKP